MCVPHPEPCLNGGTCQDGVGTFSCSCPPGFGGPRCDTEEDECGSRPCRNGGTCSDFVNSFTCTCPPGWTGPRCQHNIPDCTDRYPWVPLGGPGSPRVRAMSPSGAGGLGTLGCPEVASQLPVPMRWPQLRLELSAPMSDPQESPCPCNVPSYIWSYQHPWVVLGSRRWLRVALGHPMPV